MDEAEESTWVGVLVGRMAGWGGAQDFAGTPKTSGGRDTSPPKNSIPSAAPASAAAATIPAAASSAWRARRRPSKSTTIHLLYICYTNPIFLLYYNYISTILQLYL